MDGTSMRRIAIAGLAMGLCTAAAYQDRAERSAALRRDDNQFSQRVRGAQDSGRRICAVDRLAESRLPRTTCRSAREWRDRQLHDLRKE
jgi:hypothetical protein